MATDIESSSPEQLSLSKDKESEIEAKIKRDELTSEKDTSEEIAKSLRAESEKESSGSHTPDIGKQRSSKGSTSGTKSPDIRPQSTDSSGRPKSSSSADVSTSAKSRRKRRQQIGADAHSVTFTVVICMAIPTVNSNEDVDGGPDQDKTRQARKRMFEAPRAQNYYHFEYCLVPDEEEVIKTDVVTYGLAAKIYMERHDPKVIRTWQNGDVTWVAWSHSHTLVVTSDLLLKLFNHSLELRIWDTKDKVGTRARFDRPKLFKIPQTKQDDEEKGVRAIVSRQSKNFASLQPKKDSGIRELPTQISFQRNDYDGLKEKINSPVIGKGGAGSSSRQSSQYSVRAPSKRSMSPPPHTFVAVTKKVIEQDVGSSFSRLGRLAGDEQSLVSPGGHKSGINVYSKTQIPAASQKPKQQESTHDRQQLKSEESLGHRIQVTGRQKHRRKKSDDKNQIAAENARKYGICVIPVRLAKLFAGLQSLTSRLAAPIPGMEDAFVSVSLDGPLMSESQKQELNPMVITVQSATNMPSMPLPHGDLKSKCLPVYCTYKFFKEAKHSSLGREHSDNIYWDDVNVVLAGYLDKSELREYLSGPPMEIEIHDRDRRPEHFKLKPSLFGDDLEDEKISNVGTVASRRTLHNPFKGRDKPWDPFGLAKIDLSDFLLGQRYIYLKVPIHNCPLPDVLGYSEKTDSQLYGISGAVDGPVDGPLQAGHYVQANAMLKVKVELTYPLITPDRVVAKQQVEVTQECPFGRIVFIFKYKNTALLTQLQNQITAINAHALELDDLPQHVIDAALSTYKLSIEQQTSKDLDIVTGFQVMDGTMHMFVLEGLRARCIHDLWQALPQPENSHVKVLYNSDLIFSERLYGPLDVDLCRVKLHEPLADIISQPLLYIRDMVPKLCFGALTKLHELTKVDKIRDAVRNELFPSAEMVVCMSKEFGVPLTQEDFEECNHKSQSGGGGGGVMMSDTYPPIHPPKMINLKKKKKNSIVLYKNDSHVPQIQLANYESTITPNPSRITAQKSNTSNKSPNTRYTYCQEYHHSMTVVPVNVDALKKAREEENRARMRTIRGWTFPGMKSALESNTHQQHPDSARSEELQEPWRENLLHVGQLQPPLERDKLPWPNRSDDFELYKTGPSFFDSSVPITIHLAGKKLEHEKLEAIRKDYEDWKSRIVVSNPKPSFHRCLAETEMKEKGPKASNQTAKLKGLLKDSGSKYSLKKSGLQLSEIPPLNVVLNPSVDTVSRESGIEVGPAVEGEEKRMKGFNPGPYESRGWNLEKNKIPVYNYKHSLFEESKGSDFNVFHKNRPRLWKRPIKRLSDAERDNHLFRIPMDRFNFLSLEKKDDIFPEPSIRDPDSQNMTADEPTDMMIDIKNNQSVTNMVHSLENQKQVETLVN
ncbi:hypothetical protein ScPMuIL_007751 [Solemya velum]